MEKIEEKRENIPVQSEINVDDIVAGRIKELKSEIAEEKKKNNDPHLKYIDVAQLTPEDFIIYDKFKKGTLTAEDFSSYSEKLKQFFKERDCRDKSERIKKLKDNLKAGKMSGEEFDETFRNIMKESDEEREAIGGYEAIEKCHSRANFKAMLRNWMVDEGKI